MSGVAVAGCAQAHKGCTLTAWGHKSNNRGGIKGRTHARASAAKAKAKNARVIRTPANTLPAGIEPTTTRVRGHSLYQLSYTNRCPEVPLGHLLTILTCSPEP
jgi:hypothetical protein